MNTAHGWTYGVPFETSPLARAMDYSRFIKPQPPKKIPRSLRLPATIKMRPYQVEGAQFLMEKERALLGDDVGIGKTVQAIAAAVKPVLVVCPTYLVWQWADVISEEYPEDTIAVAGVGSRKQRHKALTGSEDLSVLPLKAPADWTIVNTDMLRGYYMPEDFQTLILDEAHHFRNREAERSKNCVELAERIPRVYQLTATPIYKDVSNFYNLLRMIDPEKYSSFWDFLDRVAVTYGDRWSTKIARLRNPKAFERELQDYMLRRTYHDVGLFLPAVIDSHKVIALEEKYRKVYDNLRDFYRKEDGSHVNSAAEVLHLLRHATVGPKVEVIPDILDDNPGATVVFCWYIETSEYCAETLKGLYKRPGDPAVINGDRLSPEDRAQVAHETIAAGGIVVATMASLSEGIDMSAAKNVIFLEEDYTPGRMHQTMGRIRRWTEDERPIMAHYLRCRNTVDTVVHAAVTGRRQTAQEILRDALE